MTSFVKPIMEVVTFKDNEDVIVTSTCSGVYTCNIYDCPECPIPGICYGVKVGG